MMTADHIAVTPYYGAPQSVAEQIGSLPELKYEQTNVGAVKVDVLGPRCRRAHRHGEARGDLQGQADTIHPLPSSPPSWCGRTAGGRSDSTRSPQYSLSPVLRFEDAIRSAAVKRSPAQLH